MLLNQTVIPPFMKGQAAIFFGGSVNIGRRMNFNPHKKIFDNIAAMTEADLRIVNLDCAVAAQGQHIDKGEEALHYLHARPEQINLLTEAKIDVVLTANNHAPDYGTAALFEQNDYLDRAGILHCGTGDNFNDASRPLFIKVNDIIIALFNVDATTNFFAATEDKPGTFYLPPDNHELWKDFFTEKIADAHTKADVVFTAVHWNTNDESVKTLGKLLIDCGADAVLGCHSHVIHGIETYKQRPIIYAAGDFLFDLKAALGGAFLIVLSKRGVEQIFFNPLVIDRCKTYPPKIEQSMKVANKFLDACQNLNTAGKLFSDGLIEMTFNPPSRAEKKLESLEVSTSRRNGEKIPPLTEPLTEWTAEKVPDDAKIEPQQFGAIKLIGCRIPPECLLMKKRQMLYVETYWTLAESTEKDFTIQILGVPTIKDSMPNFGSNMEHQACDWMFPTNRWKPGVIYREKFGLLSPDEKDIVNGNICVQVAVFDGKTELDRYIHPTTIELQLPNRPKVTSAELTQNSLPTLEQVLLSLAINQASVPLSSGQVPVSSSGQVPVSSSGQAPVSSSGQAPQPRRVPAVDVFKRAFAARNGVMFFMLRDANPNIAGLENSVFHRAKLFHERLGIEIQFVTHAYNNSPKKYLDDGIRVLNMYEYFQEIDRTVEEPRKVYIEPLHEGWKIERCDNDLRIYREDGSTAMYCFFTQEQKLNGINFRNEKNELYRREAYDTLGFLSCRQEFTPGSEHFNEVFYYRPDGTVAVHEVYEFDEDKNDLKLMELLDREGNVTKTFNKLDDALSYWFLQFLNDKTKNYFLIGDRKPEWFQTYLDAQAKGLDNVHIIHTLHSVHVGGKLDPFTSPTQDIYKFLTDKNIRSDAVITLTRYQRSDLMKRYGLTNVGAIPHAAKSVQDTSSIEREPFKIVMVGRLAKIKCYDKAIAAFKIVHDKLPQAKLHIYGKGSLLNELKQLVESEQLGDAVIFEGFTDKIDDVFASAELSILTSHAEGFAMVIQESMQNNCPVVSFDCDYGPRDMIADGVNGYLVPFGDVKALANRIIKILTEPGLREKLAANCARSVEKFSPEIVAAQWAKLFLWIMQRKISN